MTFWEFLFFLTFYSLVWDRTNQKNPETELAHGRTGGHRLLGLLGRSGRSAVPEDGRQADGLGG